MKPTRVFLSVQPIGHRRPAGAGPWHRETRPPRYRASWWTRGTSTELYRSKAVASREEAARLARKWLERRNKEAVGRPIDTRLIDTTDQPERFGYSHEKKSTAQLDDEIAAALAKE
jgi:hypothetical protein